jgi:uncharacterized protein involved in exopolysaccharide biosynthesis
MILPKPLMPVGSKPVLELLLKWLRRNGTCDAYITTGYLGHLIRIACGDGRQWDLRITYTEEPEPLGTVGALHLLREKLDGTFFMVNGDVLTDLNLNAFAAAHRQHGGALTIATVQRTVRMDYGIIEEVGNQVVQFKEKPNLSHLVSMGVYCMEPEVLDYIPAGVPFAKLLAILRRRRGVVLLFALVGAVAAATLGAWMPPHYTAKALLVVQFPPTVPNASSLSSANDDAVVQTQVAALEAPNRLYNVLTGFAHDPEVTAALNGDQRPRPAESTTPRMSAHTDPASISRVVGDVWDSLSVHISSFATDVGHALLGGEPERNLTGLARLGPEDLKRRLTIQQEHGSHVIAVSMTWTDPEIAAAFANRAVRLYLESEKERTDKDLASEMSWIDARIREESAKYERAHAAVQAYRTAHLRADQKELFDRQIADLQRQLAPGQTELIVPRVAALEQRMAALQRARDQASRDSYALADLEREAAVYRQACEDLQQRRRQLAERQEVVAPQVRLLSLAKPPNNRRGRQSGGPVQGEAESLSPSQHGCVLHGTRGSRLYPGGRSLRL